MKIFLGSIFAISLLSSVPTRAASPAPQHTQEEIDAATRLQVFLDRANFSPGKLDGYFGEFTRKALALYRQSRGEGSPSATIAPPESASKSETPPQTQPDVTGIDLASVDPLYITYTVTEADLQRVGSLPSSVAEQAKLKSLPYRDAAEAIGEKFHCDVDFLAQLNPGKTKTIRAGDQLKVPNVEPFDIGAVKDIKPGSDLAPRSAANDIDEKDDKNAAPAAPTTSVTVDTKTNMLVVHEGDKLIAAYPVTVGSEHTESPVGEWKVRGVANWPNFRYDKKMLNEGVRSSDSYLLSPGPNNPVGVVWIALNKKGIGLHGTNDPDSIGRSASHGCVRLANWDVVRLAGKVKAGVPVSIH